MKRFAALVLVLAACGGAGADTGEGVATLSGETVTTLAAEVDAEQAMFAFTECMRENGVEMSDPEVDADGNVRPGRPTVPDGDRGESFREMMRIARDECASHLEGVALGFAQTDLADLEDRLLEFAACMRDEGIDLPDPDLDAVRGPGGPGGGQGGGIFGGGIDPQDPAVQAALEACSDLLADLGRGPGGGPGRGQG